MNRAALEVDDENGTAVQMSLLSLCAAFAKYFSSGHANPRKDLLMLTSCTLTLTDEDFIKFLSQRSCNKIHGKACYKKECIQTDYTGIIACGFIEKKGKYGAIKPLTRGVL